MPGEIIDERSRKRVVRPHVWFVVPRDCIPDARDKIEIVWRECKISFEIFPFGDLFSGEVRMSHDLSLLEADYSTRILNEHGKALVVRCGVTGKIQR